MHNFIWKCYFVVEMEIKLHPDKLKLQNAILKKYIYMKYMLDTTYYYQINFHV